MAEKTVRMDEWSSGEGKDKLVTEGVDSCVAVAIYIPGKKSFLGHFSSDEPDIHTMLGAAKQEAAGVSGVKVWIAGAAMPAYKNKDLENEINHVRNWAISAVSKAGFKSPTVKWSEKGRWLTLKLPCNNGKCSLTYERP